MVNRQLPDGVEHSECEIFSVFQKFTLIVVFILAFIGVLSLVCNVMVGCKRNNSKGGALNELSKTTGGRQTEPLVAGTANPPIFRKGEL